MSTTPRAHRSQLLARAAVLLAIVVLVCVPGLTRIGQKLETTSHTPSFAKNIDCPPKKMTAATVAPSMAATLPPTVQLVEPMQLVRLAPSSDAHVPQSPQFAVPPPLRAPPATRLS